MGDWKKQFGMTTDFEFQKLQDEFKVPEVGDNYTDDRLEEIVGHSRDTSRFKTVIDRWRRYLMRTANLLLVRVRKVGYEVADAEGRLDYAVDKKERAYRSTRKAVAVLGSTDRLEVPDGKRMIFDHHMASLQRHAQAYIEDKRAMKMLPPKPTGKTVGTI